MDEEVLQGGVSNAGAVIRSGTHVLRPASPNSASIHRFLAEVTSRGFEGAPKPIAIEDDGRERLEFIPGDVPIVPYPEWAQTDEALVSVARLIRDLHDASAGLQLEGLTWCTEMADPAGGPVICHNDVCLENVVFRDGEAVAVLDFEFAAPGRRAFDLAAFARMSVPIDDELDARRLGWKPADLPARLRIVTDAYGLDDAGRADVLDILSASIARQGQFVLRRMEAGHAGFEKMWNEMGGQERLDRRSRWWSDQRANFAAALT